MSKAVTDTSRESFKEEKNSGRVGEKQQQVLNIIREHPGCTDREIHRRMTMFDVNIQVAHVVPRRNELWKLNLIRRGDKKNCPITGKLVYTWFAAEAAEAPIRGSHIKKNFFHGAGAYGQCGYCKRYSDKYGCLVEGFVCVCGKRNGFSGSFEPPTKDSQWI